MSFGSALHAVSKPISWFPSELRIAQWFEAEALLRRRKIHPSVDVAGLPTTEADGRCPSLVHLQRAACLSREGAGWVG